MKLIKRLTIVASLALVVAAVSAASASAAKWNYEGYATIKGTVTLKKNGASPVNCELSIEPWVWNEGGAAHISPFWPYTFNKCANGLYFGWTMPEEGQALLEGGHWTVPISSCCEGGDAPWTGRRWFGESRPEFVNGSGTTPSYINFKETKLGITDFGETLTATGKVNVTRYGGLLIVGS